eukprot:GEMP01092883.1.p1 GENE.GEMP01092883.1~~GEMP01092883.1.p1  ORF type:complete len:122 (+),score=20.71 GEMP01092883.1:249-614(+)
MKGFSSAVPVVMCENPNHLHNHRHSTHFLFGSEATNSGLLSLKKAMVEFAHAHHTSRNVPQTRPLANAINATRKAIDHLEGDADFSPHQEREFYGPTGIVPNDPGTQSHVINGNPDLMKKR